MLKHIDGAELHVLVEDAKDSFGDAQLYAVMGDLHRVGMNEQVVPEAVEALSFDLPAIRSQ